MKTSFFALSSFVAAVALVGCAPEIIIAGQDQDPAQNQSGTPTGTGSAPKYIVSPGNEVPGACAVEWHVVGIYDPYNPATETLGPANVHIDRPGPVGLFLTTYTATDWTVTAGPDTQIVSIVVSGYDAQTVNAPPGTPVTTLSYAQNGGFLGCGYEYPDADPYSGCETPELLTNIEQYVGQSVASFHGCYAASDFVINADLSSTSNCYTSAGYSHTSYVANSCTYTPPAPPPNEPPTDPGDLPDGCAGKDGLGQYQGYFCEPGLYPQGGPFIVTEDITCADALENCALNSSLNPDLNITCTWNGDVIYLNESQMGACSP